jgi:PAS domain S-box-containing protein
MSGYLISIILGFVLGQQTEIRLKGVSECRIPAAKQSQSALAAFNEQIKIYTNAIITGEDSLIEYGRSKGYESREALQYILNLPELDDSKKDDVEKAMLKLDEFTASAQVVYTEMCAVFGDEEPDTPEESLQIPLEDRAAALAEETRELRNFLNTFVEIYAADLKEELTSISTVSRQQRYVNLSMFFAVAASGLTLISLIIKRSIVRPLLRIVKIAEDVRSGKEKIEWLPETDDEVGVLNRSLKTMTENLRAEISERRRAEASLRRAEKKYRGIFENAVEGIFQTTPEGRILSANPAAARMVGYDSPEQLMDMVTDIQTQLCEAPEDFIKFREIINAEGQVNSFETSLRHRTREGYVRVSVSAKIVNDADGNVLHYEGLMTDITERIEKEKAERERKAAEAANKAKSEFLANMSHEIRTPLNAILGFSEILLTKTQDPVQKSYLKNILSSGRSLLTLINDILDLSKIEAGKLEIHPEYSDIRKLLSSIETVFLQKIEEKGICLQSELSENLPGSLLLDEIRIRQVLINLIGNAVKFTEHGHVSVSVSCYHTNGRINLIFEVADTGIGIPEDQQEIIFENFRQQDGQSNRKYEGTGLGLAITKRLVELMNGSISVESKPGQGSKFRVIIYDVEIADKNFTKTEEALDEDIHIQFEPAAVLLVDDVSNNRVLVKSYLENTEISVTDAKNGEEALKLLNESPPDLILMDLRMPGQNGYGTTEIIKQTDEFKHIPVIAFTASAMKSAEERINNLFDGYLQKPVNKKQLLFELKRFLPYKGDDITISDTENGFGMPADKMETAVSEEAKRRLPDLIALLENSFIPLWQEITEMPIMDEIEKFASELSVIAQEYNIQYIADYGDRLYENAQTFNIENIEKLMKYFPELLNQIKAINGA